MATLENVQRSRDPTSTMRRPDRGSISMRKICGVVLLIVGLAAIPIPILSGIPLIVAAGALLGINRDRIRRLWQSLKSKMAARSARG